MAIARVDRAAAACLPPVHCSHLPARRLRAFCVIVKMAAAHARAPVALACLALRHAEAERTDLYGGGRRVVGGSPCAQVDAGARCGHGGSA